MVEGGDSCRDRGDSSLGVEEAQEVGRAMWSQSFYGKAGPAPHILATPPHPSLPPASSRVLSAQRPG